MTKNDLKFSWPIYSRLCKNVSKNIFELIHCLHFERKIFSRLIFFLGMHKNSLKKCGNFLNLLSNCLISLLFKITYLFTKMLVNSINFCPQTPCICYIIILSSHDICQ